MMELIITLLSGETHSVHVNPNATVGELKREIAPRFKARPSQLKLSITNGQILQLDQDQKTVGDYNLRSGSKVMLLICETPAPFQVFVKNLDGQTKAYDVTDDETVGQLMRKIYQKERVAMNQQWLIYAGRQLDSSMKLQDYNIVSGSTIQLTLRLRGG
ncbi:hypothetical protein AMELA_G00242280 [Ameiurus melas]|uniref:Ubiquitin-like domain-containing protein n=1 Tax=Ameiurus melas TaxID=219545 RepID=A0A7J5ZYD3_AMEME|nr:hypothetical protein AMELA_G00242280 [Ameiurus melas]